uniref:Uncharacterized protein n=1 Tax=Caenorhabditis japonica TaxID=281687 RepID=A0A8R1IKH1_CAEJA
MVKRAPLNSTLCDDHFGSKLFHFTRVPLAERSGFILSGGPGDDEKGGNRLDLSTTALAKLEGHFLDFSPFPNSPANEKFLRRADPSHVLNSIRGKKYQDKGLKATSKIEERVRVVSKQPNSLYGGEKSSVVIEAKAKRIGVIAERIQEAFPEIVDWGNPLIASVDVVYTYGQVVHDDSKDGDNKIGENSVALMIKRYKMSLEESVEKNIFHPILHI